MSRLQKMGGVASLCLAGLFVTSFVFILFIWPRYGVTGPAEVRDPAIILPAVASAPLLSFWLAINVPIAAAILLVLLAMDERMQGDAATFTRLAVWMGFISALLFFILGVLRFRGYTELAGAYAEAPREIGIAYLAYQVVDTSVDHAAIFASGWWLLLSAWSIRQQRGWPALLRYWGLLAGVAAIIGAAVPALAPLAILLYIVWFFWLGMVLLRTSRT